MKLLMFTFLCFVLVGVSALLPCPEENLDNTLPDGWKQYPGNSNILHCGFWGIMEDAESGHLNECFYDHEGKLVTKDHEYSGCRGTEDQYSKSAYSPALLDIKNPAVKSGIEGILTSCRYAKENEVRMNYFCTFINTYLEYFDEEEISDAFYSIDEKTIDSFLRLLQASGAEEHLTTARLQLTLILYTLDSKDYEQINKFVEELNEFTEMVGERNIDSFIHFFAKEFVLASRTAEKIAKALEDFADKGNLDEVVQQISEEGDALIETIGNDLDAIFDAMEPAQLDAFFKLIGRTRPGFVESICIQLHGVLDYMVGFLIKNALWMKNLSLIESLFPV